MKKLMYMVRVGAIILTSIALAAQAAEDLISEAGKKLSLTPITVTSIEQARQEQRDALKKEKADLEKKFKEQAKKLTAESEDAKNKLAEVKNALVMRPASQFLVKKQEFLGKKLSMISDVQRAHDGILKTLAEHITLLDQYVAESTQKQQVKTEALLGSFEGLEELEQKIDDEQARTEQLKKKKEAVDKELKSAKQLSDTREQEYAQRLQEQEALRKGEVKGIPGLADAEYRQLVTLSLEDAQLAKELATAQLQEKQHEMALVDTESLLEKNRLEALGGALRTIKPSIIVTAEQLENARQEGERKQQEFLTTKARYTQELERVKKLHAEKEARLKALSKRYGIPVDAELQEWRLEPKKTYESYAGLCVTGLLSTQVLLLDAQEKRIERSIDLEREKVEYVQGLTEIKEAYYKLAIRRFVTQEALAQESKKYTEKKAALEATLKSYQTKKDETDATVARFQNQVLERIKKRRDDLQNQKNTLFNEHSKEFLTCLSQIDRAREYTANRIELLESMGKSYTESIGILQKSIGHVRFILTEFESTTIWYRPGYAVSWQGIKNSIADVELFQADVSMYLSSFSLKKLWSHIKASVRQTDFFVFMLQLSFLLFLLIGVRIILLYITRWFFIASKKYRGWHSFLLFWAMITSFMVRYYLLLVVWVILFVVLSAYPIPDPYVYILVYLLSIPYFLYVAHRFLAHLCAFNSKYEYVFIGQEFQKRVFTIASILLYATVIIMFFRQAFMLAKYPKSELPDILLALNFIIFQLSLIFLISKEQLLSVIPLRTEYGKWIRDQVSRFYYVILFLVVTFIVMSNPYVGYGRLVLYVLSQLLYTIILIRLLLWAHALVKWIFSRIFFAQVEEEIPHERFTYAKTWFGLIIIFSFVVLGTVGLLLAAKIWGWPISVADIRFWLTEPIIARGTTTPISSYAIMRVLFFVLGGFLVALGVNRFVLQKVFDLVPVDSGLQHAISSILRYIIVALAIFLGFQSVGLVGMVTYIYAVLLVGIGYMAKDSAVDFIAYFILLIQRPIKIGDYVKFDEEMVGIVRKITPKSVILVRRNSTPIIVPNSLVVTKPIYNWNYAREFTAFEDIKLTIPYDTGDPATIKKILETAVLLHPLVLKTPKPVIRLNNLGDFGYGFIVRGYISGMHTRDMFDIASDVRILLVQKLQEQGIKLSSALITLPETDLGKKNDTQE
jgi:small-conductance mechanosensitive channel